MLDPSTKRYAVLYAICELRLHDPSAPLRTNPVVANMLNLSFAAIDRALDRLIDDFGIGIPPDPKSGWKRPVLADHALASDLLSHTPTWRP